MQEGCSRSLRLIALCLCALLGTHAAALGDTVRYEVTLRGIRVAELAVTGEIAQGRYTAEVLIRSQGLAGVVRPIRFLSRAEGRRDETFVPARYVEAADTGRRQSEVEIVYDAGVPQVLRYASPRADGPDLLDPATQGGALDPATALFAGLRDLAPGEGCAAAFAIFDGRRRSEYRLSGEGPVCRGDYRRVAGYTEAEMAERTRFAVEVLFAPEGETMRVVQGTVQTIYGKVRLKRQ